MKKIFLIICCFAIFLTGCKNTEKQTENQKVIINLPSDNTVNGYRNENFATSDFISKDEVSVGENVTITVSLCGNKNSKVFHKLSCKSVKNMKEENKKYFSTREEFIKNNYSPCQMCNP